MKATIITPVKGRTDYFHLIINGVDLGNHEKSQVRKLISTLDNAI
jgi:hypothetical protein